ncbi:hypothetical protein [Streptomyces sp. NPDC002133]|uniref:hypothetical protein n=1 Tax=Streptomyces sp. NPDC002133 TaxID=3154409 RepID=UPI003328B118
MMSLPAVARAQPTADPLSRAGRLVQRLYDTAPELDAELGGIPVRGTWAPADALGPAQHEVLLAVLAEQPPRQAGVRERLARAAPYMRVACMGVGDGCRRPVPPVCPDQAGVMKPPRGR